jgi:hypothetical protein
MPTEIPVPTIAVILAYYRSNEPDGIRFLTDRDSEQENLADVLHMARRQFDDWYSTCLATGGSRVSAIALLDRQLRVTSKVCRFRIDSICAINVIGGIDMLERLGALRRDIHNPSRHSIRWSPSVVTRSRFTGWSDSMDSSDTHSLDDDQLECLAAIPAEDFGPGLHRTEFDNVVLLMWSSLIIVAAALVAYVSARRRLATA